jgi:hypothetical protein
MRTLQRASYGWLPEGKRARAEQSLIRQNRFARRVGLTMLTVTINVFFASVAITATLSLSLRLIESGVLTMPDEVRDQIATRR